VKILVYRWKAYNYTDIIENFKAMGHEVVELKYHLDNYDEDPEFSQILEENIQSAHRKGADYDIIFTVNYFAVIAIVCEKMKIHYVSWTCDNPLISMYHKSVYSKYNIIFTFDKSNEMEFRGMGVKNIHYLPLAVDAKRIQTMIRMAPADRRSIHQHAVSFVGSLYERNSYDKMEHVLSEYERGYFDALIEAQSDLYGTNVVDRLLTTDIMSSIGEKFHLQKSEDSFSDLGLIFETTVLGFKIAQHQRKRALLDLSKKYPVALYSNSDTEDLITVKYCGSVDYWTEMPLVFHESGINLNFTIPNIKTGLPLRIWDILGAGGFLLTNAQPELRMLLEEDRDFVMFSCQEELMDKVGYYSKHQEERQRIAAHGLETVEKEHTYVKRLREMLTVVEGYLS